MKEKKPVTVEDARELMKIMDESLDDHGIEKVEIIGSVAEKGKSFNDVDFKITCKNTETGKVLYDPYNDSSHINLKGDWVDEIYILKCDDDAISLAITSGFSFDEDDESNYLFEGSSPVFHYELNGKDIKIDFVVIEVSGNKEPKTKAC